MSKQIRIARAGYDAETETDPNNFIFHSAYNTLKIISQGVLTSQFVNFNGKHFDVAHGLTSIPICFAYAKFPDGKIATPFALDYSYDPTAGALNDNQRFRLEVDDTYLYFYFNHYGTNYNVDVSYFIFEAKTV